MNEINDSDDECIPECDGECDYERDCLCCNLLSTLGNRVNEAFKSAMAEWYAAHPDASFQKRHGAARHITAMIDETWFPETKKS